MRGFLFPPSWYLFHESTLQIGARVLTGLFVTDLDLLTPLKIWSNGA